MASKTPNYNLNILTYTDAVDIKPISDNFTTIDTIHKALADRVTAIEGMNLGLTTYIGFSELNADYLETTDPRTLIQNMVDSSILYGYVSAANTYYPSAGSVIVYKWAEKLIDMTFVDDNNEYRVITITPGNYDRYMADAS